MYIYIYNIILIFYTCLFEMFFFLSFNKYTLNAYKNNKINKIIVNITNFFGYFLFYLIILLSKLT